MKINAKDIVGILPKKLKRICQVGICDPKYLEKLEPVFCYIPLEYGGPRYSAKPSDVMPAVKSIITLVHFTPVALDYSVEDIVLVVANIMWRKFKIKTHVLDKFKKPDKKNLIGNENSFLESAGYEARKKIILLKNIAYYAGLGQYGKNSLIINPQFGSDIKIQALFTETEMEYNDPILPKQFPCCKDCNICVTSCPNKGIDNYKLFGSLKDECKFVVKDAVTLIGRVCRKSDIWNKALVEQKRVCRICQSFCPVNRQHYIKNNLVFAKKEKQGKIAFFLAGSNYKLKKRN